jgi:hypothetical protein
MTRNSVVIFGMVVCAAAASGSVAQPGSSGHAAASDTQLDAIECRRSIVTGSRAQTRRSCKKRSEWIKAENHLRNEWNEAIKLGNQVPPKGGT